MTEEVVHVRTSIAQAYKAKDRLEKAIEDALDEFENGTGLQVLAVDIRWSNMELTTIDMEPKLLREGVKVEVHL